MFCKLHKHSFKFFNGRFTISKSTWCASALQMSTIDSLKMSVNYFDTNDSSLRKCIPTSMLVFENFLSQKEEDALFHEVDPYMRRLRYEFDHWDNASKLLLNYKFPNTCTVFQEFL